MALLLLFVTVTGASCSVPLLDGTVDNEITCNVPYLWMHGTMIRYCICSSTCTYQGIARRPTIADSCIKGTIVCAVAVCGDGRYYSKSLLSHLLRMQGSDYRLRPHQSRLRLRGIVSTVVIVLELPACKTEFWAGVIGARS